MKPFLFTIALALTTLQLAAQQYILSGKISDENGHSIPFATVYIQNTTNGASANNEGEYTLSLNAGQYNVVFRAVGYKQEVLKIDLKKKETRNITLQTEVYQLQTVSVSATSEDPAYAIIRQAIKKRKFHLLQVKAYTADVYIKGLQKMLDAPKRFLGQNISDAGKQIGLDSNRRELFIYLSLNQN